VAVQISYVSYGGGLESRWANWVLVNSDEVIDALVHLRRLFVNAPRRVAVLGGHDITLPADGHDWNRVVLDPAVTELVREDFTHFLVREDWFRRHQLPYRRGYLLYGSWWRRNQSSRTRKWVKSSRTSSVR